MEILFNEMGKISTEKLYSFVRIEDGVSQRSAIPEWDCEDCEGKEPWFCTK